MTEKRATLEQAEMQAQVLGRKIGPHLPPGWGFCLMLFSWGPGGLMTYISNGQREDVIKALRELCDRMEKDPKGL